MKIFFEDYAYDERLVEPWLCQRHVVRLTEGRVSIPSVGYYYQSASVDGVQTGDSVFVLPKVFVNVVQTAVGRRELAFGEFPPEDIFDTDAEDNPLLKSPYYNEIFSLSAWIYRAIERYKERHESETITEMVDVRNVDFIGDSSSQTWINIILQLTRFAKEHKDLFVYISRVGRRGHRNVHWSKTIAHETPLVQDDVPVYLQFRSRSTEVDYDEALLMLFHSVLDYLHERFHFTVARNLNYPTSPRYVERLIASERGTRLLRSIRRKYFKDELVQLWHLLYVFFEKAERIASKRSHEETLMARNFNLVFEDMVDSIVSDDTKELHPDLKEQPDGKVVDHIYRYASPLAAGDIYYIGDSKYYKEGTPLPKNSVYKQFTYARNVIQYCVDPKRHDPSLPCYRDAETEGYSPSPNFFIRGRIDSARLSYTDDQLRLENDGFFDGIALRPRHTAAPVVQCQFPLRSLGLRLQLCRRVVPPRPSRKVPSQHRGGLFQPLPLLPLDASQPVSQPSPRPPPPPPRRKGLRRLS